MKKTSKKGILAASVAGILAVSGLAINAHSLYAEADEIACSGINSCKGTGACAGKSNACAGKNACKGQGWIKVASVTDCTQKGGTVVKPAM